MSEENSGNIDNPENSGNNIADASQQVEAGSRRKPDILTPNSREAKELEQFIERGHRSAHTVRILAFMGIIILIAALFYWNKADFYPVSEDQWLNFGEEYLPIIVENQAKKEGNSFRLRPGVELPPQAPFWPNIMYRKLRMDIYILGGVIFILCWIVIRIEGAKYMRNDLLAFRALAREIEKLRLRVRELENSCDDKSRQTK